MKLSTIFALFLWSNVAFSQTDTSKVTVVKDNYQIQHPQSWIFDASKIMGTECVIFAPLEDATDQFTENVNLMIQGLTGQDIDIQQYKQISEMQIKEYATDLQVYESTIITINNIKYFRTSYAMAQGKSKLKITSLCFINNDKAYLLTFTAEHDKYEQYKKVGEDIIYSFTLVK